MERVAVLIKPGNECHIPEIEEAITSCGLSISSRTTVTLTRVDVALLYPDKACWEFREALVSYMTSGVSTALLVEGDDAVAKMTVVKGKTYADCGIRGKYATDFIHNVLHCATEACETARDIGLFFREGG